jgi:hypothetical protein
LLVFLEQILLASFDLDKEIDKKCDRYSTYFWTGLEGATNENVDGINFNVDWGTTP